MIELEKFINEIIFISNEFKVLKQEKNLLDTWMVCIYKFLFIGNILTSFNL